MSSTRASKQTSLSSAEAFETTAAIAQSEAPDVVAAHEVVRNAELEKAAAEQAASVAKSFGSQYTGEPTTATAPAKGASAFDGGATGSFDQFAKEASAKTNEGVEEGKKDVQQAVDSAKTTGGQYLDSAKATTGSVVDSTKATAGSVVDSTKATTGSVVDSVSATTGSVVESTKATAASVVGTVASTTGAVVDTTKATTASVVDTTKATVDSALATTGAYVESGKATAGPYLESAKSATGTVYGQAKAVVDTLVDTAQTYILPVSLGGKPAEELPEGQRGLADSARTTAASVTETVKQTAQPVVDTAKGMTQNVLGTAGTQGAQITPGGHGPVATPASSTGIPATTAPLESGPYTVKTPYPATTGTMATQIGQVEDKSTVPRN